jgi:hypothetical protein
MRCPAHTKRDGINRKTQSRVDSLQEAQACQALFVYGHEVGRHLQYSARWRISAQVCLSNGGQLGKADLQIGFVARRTCSVIFSEAGTTHCARATDMQ